MKACKLKLIILLQWYRFKDLIATFSPAGRSFKYSNPSSQGSDTDLNIKMFQLLTIKIDCSWECTFLCCPPTWTKQAIRSNWYHPQVVFWYGNSRVINSHLSLTINGCITRTNNISFKWTYNKKSVFLHVRFQNFEPPSCFENPMPVVSKECWSQNASHPMNTISYSHLDFLTFSINIIHVNNNDTFACNIWYV